MYMSVDQPIHSLRCAYDGTTVRPIAQGSVKTAILLSININIIQVGGIFVVSGHSHTHGDPPGGDWTTPYTTLEKWVREHFPVKVVSCHPMPIGSRHNQVQVQAAGSSRPVGGNGLHARG
jgi:hypothetical protein